METRKLNPRTPGTRHQIILIKNLLSKNSNFIKNLKNKFHLKCGRSFGRITVRHLGGGHKKSYRLINFGNFSGKFIVISNFYDPFRNSFISLIFNLVEKKFDFLLMTGATYSGTFLLFDFEDSYFELSLGFRTSISNIPTGSFISNISKASHLKGSYIRSAGTFGQLIQKTYTFFKIRLPSGQILTVPKSAIASIGIVSNSKYNQIVIGKAGRNRLLGKRPSVRGVAMNPVDHPHGGNTTPGCNPVTPWGLPTRGKPTKKK
jgi:large subunit ribosomal protein L2